MSINKNALDKLVDRFTDTGELGHWDFSSIMLYDIKYEENTFADIIKRIEDITIHYAIDIIPTINGYANINIRDIKE